MSKQSISLLALTITASGGIVANRFVTPVNDQAGAGENTLGVARTDAADGELVTVDVLGTAVVEAGAQFSAGDSLKVGTGGKAIEYADSGAKVAVALQDAAGDGSLVEVLLIPNVA